MSDVRFYQLGRRPLEQVLAVMLERCYERGQRALVQAGSPERVEALAEHLWTYRDRSFLPHGTAKDGHAAMHPIWLTAESEAPPNAATVLFLTDGSERDGLEIFDLVAVIFDGSNSESLQAAREYWKRLRATDLALTYWAEDEAGRWEKKA
ncbi:MAG: DNA polymerase III subunit chi [Pseudomonadota bacterium]